MASCCSSASSSGTSSEGAQVNNQRHVHMLGVTEFPSVCDFAIFPWINGYTKFLRDNWSTKVPAAEKELRTFAPLVNDYVERMRKVHLPVIK